MIRYRVRTYTLNGRPLSQVLMYITTVPSSAVREEVVVTTPMPYWNVRDLRATLFLEVDVGKGRTEVLIPPGQPEWFQREARRDAERAGGAINMSGWYPVRSARALRWLEGKKVRDWLLGELQRLGVEIV